MKAELIPSECLESVNMDDLQLEDSYESNSDDEQSDTDDCDEVILKQAFTKTYTFCAEKALTLDKHYILYMDCISNKICVGLSNNTSEIYEIRNDQLNMLCTLKGHKNSIVGVKFSPDQHILYTGSSDGTVKLWDIRTADNCVSEFKDTTASSPENIKPLSCFDTSCNNRVLCAGTELYESDAFLLFWDIRNSKILGGYWESHMDDITQVSFHPTNKDKLASGSTDGLINIYDLKETSEDDALMYSLNTESSVEQIMWYTQDDKEAIATVTHPVQMQLWKIEDGVPHAKFSREDLTKAMKRKSADHCYVANMHLNQKDVFLLAGSNWHNGECVRGLDVWENQLLSNFILQDNKQRIRSSWFNNKDDILITGGERGILNIWKPSTKELNHKTTLKNISIKVKPHMTKPY